MQTWPSSVPDVDIPGLDVSRETLDRLKRFADLLVQWTAKINLISQRSATDLWNRHVRDSAQLVLLVDRTPIHWVDLGSGGGLPGIVVAIIGAELWPGARFTLVESDQRKATFLRTVVRDLHLTASVCAERAELLSPQNADVLSARALAPLTDLLGYADRHLAPGGVAIFPKGRSMAAEVDQARRHWSFALAIHPSLTDHEAGILRIERIEHA